MAKLKGEFQGDNGDILYPHTSSDVVFGADGKTVEEQINGLSTGLNDRGIWVLPKDINSGSCNSLTTTGLYLVSSYYVDNCPTAKGTDWLILLR